MFDTSDVAIQDVGLRAADSLTAICEPIVYIYKPRHLIPARLHGLLRG
jgi:hypothetical protein